MFVLQGITPGLLI